MAAAFAGVSPRTIHKWMDMGWLPGSWRMPSIRGPVTGHRRIAVESLAILMRAHGMKVPQEMLKLIPELVE